MLQNSDLVALHVNPQEDIHNSNTIRFVMKNGELFEGDTLEKISPERQERPPLGYRTITSPNRQH